MKNLFKYLLFSTLTISFGLASVVSGLESTTTTATSVMNMNADISKLYKSENNVAVVSPDQVSTEDDLNILEKNYAILNPNITNIRANTNSDGTTDYTIEYKHPGKFLGLVPGSYKTTTLLQTTANGIPNIDSTLSVWSSLVSDKTFNREKIIDDLKNNSTIQSEAKVNASPSSRAKVIEAMIAVLQENELSEIGPATEKPSPLLRGTHY